MELEEHKEQDEQKELEEQVELEEQRELDNFMRLSPLDQKMLMSRNIILKHHSENNGCLRWPTDMISYEELVAAKCFCKKYSISAAAANNDTRILPPLTLFINNLFLSKNDEEYAEE